MHCKIYFTSLALINICIVLWLQLLLSLWKCTCNLTILGTLWTVTTNNTTGSDFEQVLWMMFNNDIWVKSHKMNAVTSKLSVLMARCKNQYMELRTETNHQVIYLCYCCLVIFHRTVELNVVYVKWN